MPVTILYQGTPLTFPNLDSPDEAYKQLGDTPSASAAPAAGQSEAAPAALQPINAPQGIDPKLLAENKDWLTASKTLYNTTQGHNWDESKGNAALAEFGLERMARFHYNLPLMGIDAVSLKNAPDNEKKAFLYLLDNFDKVNYSWEGAKRFAKYAALDPMNYVGLSTFGVGSLASEGAKLTTAAGIKAALKTGVLGAIEGAGYGAAQQRLEQEGRVNAGGQDSVDYGQVGKGAAVGGALGAVLAPLISVAKNHFAGEAAEHVAERPGTETPSVAGNESTVLPSDPPLPSETEGTPISTFADHADTLPAPGQPFGEHDTPIAPSSFIQQDQDRLMSGWAEHHENIPANGQAFEHPDAPAPETHAAMDDAITQAANLHEASAGSNFGEKTGVFDNVPKPAPEEKIGGVNGPTFMELKQTLKDIGDSITSNASRGWQALTDVSNPLTRALLNLSDKDAKDIADKFAQSAMTQDEFKGFTAATIKAQNTVKQYIDGLLDDRAKASTPEMKSALASKIAVAERIMDPLKSLAKEAGTTSGVTLRLHAMSQFKGLERDRNLDSILQDMGLDRLLATDDQKADAVQKWFTSMVDKGGQLEKMDQLVSLRRDIANTIDDPKAMVEAMNKYAETLDQVNRANFGGLSPAGKLNELRRSFLSDAATFLAHTVLSPSSLTVNTVSNAMMVFSRPALDFIVKADRDAFRQMTASYGAMFSVSSRALAQARLAFQMERSILTGKDAKFMESNFHRLETDTGKGNLMKFAGRNGVRIWTRALNATDEFFQVVSYHGFVEGDATAKALLAAKQQKLSPEATSQLVKDYVAHKVKQAYATSADQTVIGDLRDAGIKQGYSGDNLKLYVQNQLDKNPTLLRRATNEEGISYTNDLLFKREFSGDNTASGMAKMYEKFVSQHPEMRIMGQLFFRTPVRVFEAGMRLTPGVQLIVPKFWDDLAGHNGLAREVRARGEIMAAYGATASVITAFSTGGITGSGYNLDPLQRKNLEAKGWRAYSIKVGDKYISYRNFDPVSTPIKIIVNAMERLQMIDYRTAQGEMDQKSSLENVLAYVGLGSASILKAVQDANLTQGVDDIVKLFEALADPDRKENAFKQLSQSKIQLTVPNAIRKGIKFFGDGQNVQTDASTMDQVLEAVINPASEQVTHKFDALGNPMTTQQQGFFPYIGIDAAGREARSRGLPEQDVKTLSNIANLSVATGKSFNPPSKWGNIDLKQTMSQDGTMTLYNKAMQEFNRNIPKAASEFFEQAGNVPAGRRGMSGPKAQAFERMHNNLWSAAIATVGQKEPAIFQAMKDKRALQADVNQGNREVAPPIQ